MEKKICCFAGHSKLYNTEKIYMDLVKLIEKLIKEESVDEFWVGNYGDFDYLSQKAVRSLKEKYPDIHLILIIPYLTADINKNRELYSEEYDNILVADLPEKTPAKYRILKCNEYMVDNSDYLICYVEYGWGGASKTFSYAQKKKRIKILNLAC